MVKKLFYFVCGIAIVGGGVLLYPILFPPDEVRIQKRLKTLAGDISFSREAGNIVRTAKTLRVPEHFTDDCVVRVNIRGFQSFQLNGKVDIAQSMKPIVGRLDYLKVELLDPNIRFERSAEIANVHLTAKLQLPGLKDFTVQEFRFQLVEVEGDWLIHEVETMEAFAR